jgi:hypothetical protein
MQQARRGHVRDDDIVGGRLLQRHAGVLCVDHAVVVARMRTPDGHVAERVVDVATRGQHAGVGEEEIDDVRVHTHHAPPVHPP